MSGPGYNMAKNVTIPKIYIDIPAHATHLLIAGATGSGKSTATHGIIAGIRASVPGARFSFIDLKMIEMIRYKGKYYTSYYADTAPAAMKLLERINIDMMKRYKRMKRKRITKYPGPPTYLIIDEYAELWIQTKKQCIPLVQSILQLGRAAGYRAIICTQNPLAKILDTPIKSNIDSMLALRTRSAQDSRTIINCKGAETLPRYGSGLFYCPDIMQPITVQLPLLSPETATARLE